MLAARLPPCLLTAMSVALQSIVSGAIARDTCNSPTPREIDTPKTNAGVTTDGHKKAGTPSAPIPHWRYETVRGKLTVPQLFAGGPAGQSNSVKRVIVALDGLLC